MESPLVIITGTVPEQQFEVERMLRGQYSLGVSLLNDPHALVHLCGIAQAAIVINPQWPLELNRNWPYLKNLPVVLVLIQPSARQVQEAYHSGVTEVLLWPCQSEELQEAVKKCLAMHGAQHKGERTGKWGLAGILFKWFTPALHLRPENAPVWAQSEETTLLEEQTGQFIHAHLLGPFSLALGDMPVILPGKKEQELMAYLLFHHPHPLRKEKLTTAIWGVIDPDAARNRLNVTLHRIRKCLDMVEGGADWIQYDRETNAYHLEFPCPLKLDLTEFRNLALDRKKQASLPEDQSIHRCLKAIDCYTGDFLEGFQHSEWVEREREELQEYLQSLLVHAASYFLTHGMPAQAIPYCQRCLEMDPCLENMHQKLILAYALSSQRSKALRQHRRCEQVLWEELKLEPSATTQELVKDVKDGRVGNGGVWLERVMR